VADESQCYRLRLKIVLGINCGIMNDVSVLCLRGGQHTLSIKICRLIFDLTPTR
jgi:hypothetical protein